MKSLFLKYFIETTYILCPKGTICRSKLKNAQAIFLEKYLVKAMHKQIRKYKNTLKMRSYCHEKANQKNIPKPQNQKKKQKTQFSGTLEEAS